MGHKCLIGVGHGLVRSVPPPAAWAGGAGEMERFSVAMVFVVRNVGVATALAVTVLGRLEFAVFATAYFLSQVPLLLVAVLLYRAVGAAAPGWRGAE